MENLEFLYIVELKIMQCCGKQFFSLTPVLFHTLTSHVLTFPSFKSMHLIFYSTTHSPFYSIFWLLQKECLFIEGKCFSQEVTLFILLLKNNFYIVT